MSDFSWESPTWGQAGHNVHEADNGSWVADRHTETAEDF